MTISNVLLEKGLYCDIIKIIFTYSEICDCDMLKCGGVGSNKYRKKKLIEHDNKIICGSCIVPYIIKHKHNLKRCFLYETFMYNPNKKIICREIHITNAVNIWEDGYQEEAYYYAHIDKKCARFGTLNTQLCNIIQNTSSDNESNYVDVYSYDYN